MRFRQVHLDFHTSEAIARIGASFEKQQFQQALQTGRVNSITVFSKCHHGWAYHPSEANETHPELRFDLLGAMIEAAHEIDVKTPVYISAGLDEKLARRHPEWLARNENDETGWVKGFMQPGYHRFCFNTPYLDILIPQVEEVVRRYDVDGIFLDIVGVHPCYCQYCVASLRARGLHPRDREAVVRLAEETYATYTSRVRRAIDAIKPGLPVFHNGGHIRRGRRDLAFMNTHLELESLPTGGWGYDHFPLSARYVHGLGLEFLGMTGKFHTTWGEFGGYKHPNALRYEAALSIANGACCSIGDQLHPEGAMDPATYRLIGAAYAEVEGKEAWCRDVRSVADVALLTMEAMNSGEERKNDRTGKSDSGAVRMLLEGNVLFDVVDRESDFAPYKVLLLPDDVRVAPALAAKLNAYVAGGGKLLATGSSGLDEAGETFAVDFGAKYVGESPCSPEYFRPAFTPAACGAAASYVMYAKGRLVEALPGSAVLGVREFPYFNRDVFAFCSHQHTPSAQQDSGPAMVEGPAGIYIAWNVFEDYATKGSLILRDIVLHAVDRLLGEARTLVSGLPAQGVATLMEQPSEQRYVHHLLYASPVRRGERIEVIEDIVPLFNIDVSLRLPRPVLRVYLAPQMTELDFAATDEGRNVSFRVPKLECHQMVVLDHA